MLKTLFFAAYLFTTCSIFAGEQVPRFGITVLSSREPACATFQGQELNPGQRVIVAAFNSSRWFDGRVIKKSAERCKTFDALEGIAYEVHLETTDTSLFGTGVAIVADTTKKIIKGRRPVFFLRGNEQAIVMHKCTSSETVHYSAWQGRHRIWYDYNPLGYDAEPTCTKEEAGG
jgi:hypothetical protein